MSIEAAIAPVIDRGIVKLSENELIDLGIDLNKIPGDFEGLRAVYATRNVKIREKLDLFDGVHWETEPEDPSQYQLVLNYIRNAVLRYAAILSRKPLPKVPYPGTGVNSAIDDAANRCERYLYALWPNLWQAWRDVELDADKVGYGVLQVIWSPFDGQPETVNIGQGEEVSNVQAYTKCPFKFRATKPSNFYPIYRTYDVPNDYLAVYRFDPGRLVVDLEEQFGVSLQPTGYGPLDTSEGDIFTEPTCDLIELWTQKAYVLTALTRVSQLDRRGVASTTNRYAILEAGKNPFKCIPFWLLQNIRNPHADPTYGGSLADMDDLGDLVKHLEEMESEHAQEIATHIHSPIVYKSEEHMNDPSSIKFAPGAVFPIGIEEELDTLNWSPNPAGVEGHLDRIFAAIQDLSFLGEAGFGRLAAGMSGIGFKIALTPMEQILELKTPNRILALESIAEFLLTTFKAKAKGDAKFRTWVAGRGRNYGVVELAPDDIGSHPVVTVDFGNVLPRDEYTHEQAEVYKWKSGGQSLLTTLDNIGVEDSLLELNRIRAELQDEVLNPDHAMKLVQLKMAKQQAQQPQPQPGQVPGQQPGQQPGQVPGGRPGGPQQLQMGGSRPLSAPPGIQAAGGVPPGMGMMGGPSTAISGQPSGVGMPGGAQGGGAGGMQAMLQAMQQGMGGMSAGPQGMPPMVPPGVTGGPNTPPPEEEGQGPGKLAPFLPRR